MSPGFALLRAPQTVQTQVLNIFKPQEIFILSMCSKRAYKLVKVHRKNPEKGELTMVEDLFSNAFIKYPNEKFSSIYDNMTIGGTPVNRLVTYRDLSSMPSETELINIGDNKVPAEMDPDDGRLVTYWEDRVHGIKTVIDYVTRLFNMSVDSFIIKKKSLWLIDWVNSRQESLKEATIYERNPVFSDDDFQHMLTNCKPTEELHLLVEAPPNFRFTGVFQKPNVLKIERGPWVTLDNLIAMDSIEIHLGDSMLECSDINVFLKHWLAGGSPRLSYANIQMRRMSHSELFRDLTEVQVPEKRQFKLLNGTVQNFSNAYDIQRNDGVRASVSFIVPRKLAIFVWSESE